MNNDHRPGGVIAKIRAQLPALQPTEQAVANMLLQRSDDIVELTSQQIADLAGASRPTVVRTCQSLGFTGYQQLRVLLARDAVAHAPKRPRPSGPAAIVTATFDHVRTSIASMTALLSSQDLERSVRKLVVARRVLVVGNGFSASLALDAASRMTSIGRLAEVHTDAIAQQVAARQLDRNDMLFVLSGSGANRATLLAANYARQGGATVVVVTSFSHSPLIGLADIALIVGMPEPSFHDEITITSRIPLVILLEGLIAALTVELGDRATEAKAATLEIISENLAE